MPKTTLTPIIVPVPRPTVDTRALWRSLERVANGEGELGSQGVANQTFDVRGIGEVSFDMKPRDNDEPTSGVDSTIMLPSDYQGLGRVNTVSMFPGYQWGSVTHTTSMQIIMDEDGLDRLPSKTLIYAKMNRNMNLERIESNRFGVDASAADRSYTNVTDARNLQQHCVICWNAYLQVLGQLGMQGVRC